MPTQDPHTAEFTGPPEGAAESTPPGPAEPPPTSRDVLPGVLMALGVTIALFVTMGRLKRMRRLRANETFVPPSADAATRLARRETLDAAKADLEQFTREMAALLDNRAARLELLIEEADAKLARLEAASGDVNAG